MKQLIKGLKNDYLVYALAVFGVALVFFPHYIVRAVPYLMGVGLIAYGAFNLYAILSSGNREAHPGAQIVHIAVGLVALILREDATVMLGVIWAWLVLHEVAEEVDEYYHTRELHVLRMLWAAVSLVLAVMLMHKPAHHFVFHMRILGLETLVMAFLRIRDGRMEEA